MCFWFHRFRGVSGFIVYRYLGFMCFMVSLVSLFLWFHGFIGFVVSRVSWFDRFHGVNEFVVS